MANSLKLEVLFNSSGNLPDYIETIIGGADHLSKKLRTAQGELKNLEFDQRQISKFREYREVLDKTNDELQQQKRIVSELKSKADLSPLTAKQTKELAKAEKEVTKLNKAYEQQSNKLISTAQHLHRAGMSVETLAQDEANLKDKILRTNMEIQKRAKALDTAQKAQAQYQKTQDMLNKGQAMAQKGLMLAGAGAVTMVIPAKLSIDFESSMADVAKVVDGLRDGAGKVTPAYTKMSQEIISMSTRLPMAATDIATIVAAGGQSGIAANELTKFAETAVKMGVAFDISADQAGQSMAELRTIFQMSQDDVVTLADKINYLGNSTTVTSPQIMEVIQRVGAIGKAAGISEGSIAALAASIPAVAPEVAATGLKGLVLALTKGSSATKTASTAFKKLGLDTVQVAKAMQRDAEGTIINVMERIKNLSKDEQIAMTNVIFGSEALPVVQKLSSNLDGLKANLQSVGDASLYAGSMDAEYAARAETTANNLQLLKNKTAAVGITIGNTLLPMLNAGIDKIGNIITKVQIWAEKNPALASTLTKVAIAAIAIIGGVSALALMLTTVLGPLAMLKMALTTLGGGMGMFSGLVSAVIGPLKMLGTVFTTVGRTMLANPIILAITLIAGAAYLIYKNWEPIKSFFIDLWNSISNGAQNLWAKITTFASNAWNGLIDGISSVWAKIADAFNTGVNFIKGIIQSIDTVFANNPILNLLFPIIGIPRLIIANWSSISAFFSQIWTTITSYISTGISLITSIVNTGFGLVLGVVNSVWTSISNFINQVWTTISGYINAGISLITNIVSTGFNVAKDFISTILNTIKSIVSTAWSALCNIFLTITPLGFIVKNFDQIVAFLTGLKDRMLAIGKNIIQGLIDGIKDGFGGLKSIWNKVNSYMPDFMKKKMDIHSPSRVMMGMGGYIMEGLQLGVAQGQQPLQKQFDKTTNIFSAPSNKVQATPMITNSGGRNVTIISQDRNEYNIHVSGNSPVKQIIAEIESREKAKTEAMKRSFKSYRDQE